MLMMLQANWGDEIIVHLTNSLQNNGTSIHFHGARQNYTNEMDGVPSITQCALAPGESMTYKWRAVNYGTSWYHSHFSIQTYEGVFGPMIVHGPSSAPFDIDLGTFTVQDWSHVPVDALYDGAQTVGPFPEYGPRTLDTGLINGKNVWTSESGEMSGSFFETTMTAGKTHLLRVVNTAIQSTFKFHLDGHKFTVVAADYVPIVPYETDIISINIGQRYDVIVKADQAPGDYWLRSDNQQVCSTLLEPNAKAIVHYAGYSGTPTSVSKNYTDECVDEPYASLVPVVALNAGPEDQEVHENVLIGPGREQPNLFKWTLDGTTFQSQWGDPTLQSIVNNGTVPDYSGSLAIELPNLNEWVYVIIETPIPMPHPIHLHGHDFYILAQGVGRYMEGQTKLNTINPPRRDVALMPWTPPSTPFDGLSGNSSSQPSSKRSTGFGGFGGFGGSSPSQEADDIAGQGLAEASSASRSGAQSSSQDAEDAASEAFAQATSASRPDAHSSSQSSSGSGGYLVLAFETDNPGAWLMHCHIGWHVAMGFALQFIENLDGIKKTVKDACQMDDTCITWNKYATENHIVVDNSGV
jgi:FtsP/CotA-like multicopper oxidase with cupredoxin domain